METEYEVKFYPVDKDKMRQKLKKLGAKLVYPERKMKRVIVDKKENHKLKVDYIRVRDEGNSIRLSAKTHAKIGGKVSDQKELEVEVSDFGKMKKIIELAGLSIDRYQETLRETWKFQEVEIYLDTWPWMKPRLEIEGKSIKEIKKVAEELGFNWQDKIIVGMTELYMNEFGISEEEVIEKISYIDFEKNPFKK